MAVIGIIFLRSEAGLFALASLRPMLCFAKILQKLFSYGFLLSIWLTTKYLWAFVQRKFAVADPLFEFSSSSFWFSILSFLRSESSREILIVWILKYVVQPSICELLCQEYSQGQLVHSNFVGLVIIFGAHLSSVYKFAGAVVLLWLWISFARRCM